VRVGTGATHVIAPVSISAPLVGNDARTPSARVFIGAFGIREALLGLATASARTDEELQRWLMLGVMIDTIDALGVMKRFRSLPPGRRWIALTATGGPAILGAVLAGAIA
jgi:hypothetical protein